jgi:hypothetical protein
MAQIICSRQPLPTVVFDTPSTYVSAPVAVVVVSAAEPAVVVVDESSSPHAAATSAKTASTTSHLVQLPLSCFICFLL